MPIRQFKSIVLVALALLVGLISSAQAAQSITIATNPPYRPMEYTTPSGQLKGFDIELGNAMCKQAGLECEWTPQSWNGIIPGLMAHKYDAIMSSMTINKRRKKHVLFSNPYIVVPSAFYIPKSSSLQEIGKKSLKGKNIGVQRGTVQDDYVTAEYDDIATIKRYKNASGVTTDMSTGRVDVAFFDEITGHASLIEKHPGKYKQIGPKLTKPKKYFGSGFGIAFRKGEKALAKKVNKALATLKENGTYAEIHKKYFGNSSDKGYSE
ncbi:transporter substrate-binding domain-containing protein [Salinisphaera sp. USBA-960]|uniref:transporter substrate-binding domain-containing protein n=1 Tax=Salinisphaera orenii TaxID=856731 RepID=UPI000DBE4D51|nr:transporter substrate-binding domain-containing protein [Salifodinibacter halophilus]NNC26226.1 transporter substrate-binding domain-containing protein [Salifodinibacter halophilus]